MDRSRLCICAVHCTLSPFHEKACCEAPACACWCHDGDERAERMREAYRRHHSESVPNDGELAGRSRCSRTGEGSTDCLAHELAHSGDRRRQPERRDPIVGALLTAAIFAAFFAAAWPHV